MRYALIAMTAVLTAASAAFGAATPWVPPSGSTSNFSYANGFNFNDDGFGNPTVNSSGFTFAPTSLVSISSNGSTNNDSDTAAVDLTAPAGKSFTSITAQVAGDYTVFGTGNVNAIGALSVINLDTNAVLALPMTFTGTPATTTTSINGLFTGTVTIDLPAGWTHVNLGVPNTDSSFASAGSSSLIQTKSVSILISTNVPEPTIALATVSVLGLAARRSRR